MVVSGFTFTRSPIVVAGLVIADEPLSTLTAELISSLAELVAEGLALVTEVDNESFVELLAEALAEVSIFVDDVVDDDAPVEEGFEAPSEGTTAELIGSPAELSTAELVVEASELVTVESVDEACEDPTEVDDAPLVEG